MNQLVDIFLGAVIYLLMEYGANSQDNFEIKTQNN